MQQRFDVGTFDSVEKTPQGGLRVAATLTKTGLFRYQTPAGERVEYRSPDEVFHADSLATLADAPLTVGHPGLVSPDNHSDHAVGHVRDVKQDGARVSAQVVVQGRKAMRAIEKGTRQVSCGYVCDFDATPGTTPDGEHYDGAQRDIRYNHVALVDKGRAGSDVCLRLDSAGNQLSNAGDPTMKVERIDGIEYEIDTDAHRDAVKRRDVAIQAAKDAHNKLEARADMADAKVKKLETELADLPKKIAEQATARAALETGARSVLGAEAKFDGLSDSEVRAKAIAKASPDVRLDGKSDAYLEAAFDLAIASGAGTTQRNDAVATGELRKSLFETSERNDEAAPDVTKAYEAMVKREQNRWKGTPADKAKA